MVKRVVCICVLLTTAIPLFAQNLAIKSNLLYDLTTTLNLGVEGKIAPKWTIDLSANYNPFSFSNNRKWKHWMVQPEVRYWFTEAFNRHFVGTHLMGGVFNSGNIHAPSIISLFPTDKGYRYEGEMYGAGFTYGYHLVLSSRWSMEYAIGLGWMHTDYDKFECVHCGDLLKSSSKEFLGVTKAAISLVYTINRPKNEHKPQVTDYRMPADVVVKPADPRVETDSIKQSVDTIAPTETKAEPASSSQEEPIEVILSKARYYGDFLFPWDSPVIHTTLPGNAVALDTIVTSIRNLMADASVTIDSIVVKGYASPEGRAGYNRQLSERRARAFADYLVAQISDLAPQLVHAEGCGEDWEAFTRMLADQPLGVPGIESLLQQVQENPSQADVIESQIRRKAGNILKQKYYPSLRRITINIVGTRHGASAHSRDVACSVRKDTYFSLP